MIPFGVIEYLFASGLYRRKFEATRDVLGRLDISEDTLNDWRKKQRLHNATAFDLQLSCARKLGEWVGGYRRKVKEVPAFRPWIEYQDQQFGLAAVDHCARALKNVGAHKGQK